MRIYLFVLLLVLFFPSFGYAVNYTLDANCLAAWLMDVDEDPISDATGNGKTGTLKGAGEPDYTAAGGIDGGYSFDGSDDYIEFTTLDVPHNADMTIYIHADADILSGSTYASFGTKATSVDGWACKFEQYNNTGLVGFTLIGVGDYSSNISTPTTFEGYVWVYDDTASTVAYYVDQSSDSDNVGNEVATDTVTGAYLCAYNNGTLQDESKAIVGEAAIFDRTFDATESQDIIDNGLVTAVVTRRVIMISKMEVE